LFINTQAYSSKQAANSISFAFKVRQIPLACAPSTHRFLIFHLLREIGLNNLNVRQQNLNDSLGKASHVTLPDFRIGTFELANDVEALRQLSKYVNNGIGEESVFTATEEL